MKAYFLILLGIATFIANVQPAEARPWKSCTDQGNHIEVLVKPDHIDDAITGSTLGQMGFDVGIPGVNSSPDSTMSSLRVANYQLTQDKIIMSLRAYLWPQESGMGAVEGDTYPMGRHFLFVLNRDYTGGVLSAQTSDGAVVPKYLLNCRWLD